MFPISQAQFIKRQFLKYFFLHGLWLFSYFRMQWGGKMSWNFLKLKCEEWTLRFQCQLLKLILVAKKSTWRIFWSTQFVEMKIMSTRFPNFQIGKVGEGWEKNLGYQPKLLNFRNSSSRRLYKCKNMLLRLFLIPCEKCSFSFFIIVVTLILNHFLHPHKFYLKLWSANEKKKAYMKIYR